MADLSVLIPKVAVFVPEAPDPLVVEMLREAVDTLAVRTKCWIVQSDAVDIEEGEARYRVEIESTLLPVCVREVRLNGAALEPRNLPDWEATAQEWPSVGGLPDEFAQVSPDAIVLNRIPIGVTGSLIFGVAVRPGRALTRIPDWLLNDQQSAIVAGALGNLMMMPRKAWSDPAGGAVWLARFEAAVNELSWRVAKGFVASGPSSTARFF